MKLGAPILLALIALMLSIYTLVSTSRPAPEPTPVSGDKASGGMPSLDPTLVQGCDGEGKVTDLADLMKVRINPMLTRISYELHHNADADPATRLGAVGDTSAKLLGCIVKMPAYPPEIPVDRMPEYFRLLDELQAHTLALQVSAMEADEDGARHWFGHMKQSCFACHARFRSEE